MQGFTRLMQAGGVPLTSSLVPHATQGVQSDPRLSIARVKNGFPKNGGYRDIKVNVVFMSVQGFAMMGEVALVLDSLVRYKDATHELYEIVREGDFFKEVSDAMKLMPDVSKQ